MIRLSMDYSLYSFSWKIRPFSNDFYLYFFDLVEIVSSSSHRIEMNPNVAYRFWFQRAGVVTDPWKVLDHFHKLAPYIISHHNIKGTHFFSEKSVTFRLQIIQLTGKQPPSGFISCMTRYHTNQSTFKLLECSILYL